MGDRKNPIMFGPEWLRNLPPSDPSAGRSSSRSSSRPGAQSTGPEPGGQTSNASARPLTPPAGPSTHTPSTTIPSTSAPSTSTPSTSTRNSNASWALRSRLEKQRYGREEMLALCEKSGDPPEELKSFDLLYQAREKKPIALLSFEEEVRENTGQRGGPSTSTQSAERFGGVRGAARIATIPEARGRARLPFLRHTVGLPASRSTSAPLHAASVRTPGFSTGPDEEPAPPRSWTASNGGMQPNRPGEQAEWSQNKISRRRSNNLTNWRQTPNHDNDEWRGNDTAGRQYTRSNSDRWEREWIDGDRRPPLDRPQSWSNNRRPWVNDEENLPEWAMDNGEAGAGTFDSSGAFHGYNNDDSNVPKPPEANYALSRSHTHAGFSRARRDFEEGAEGWWASEKANKLSPKRFEAQERKNKQPQAIPSEPQPTNATAKQAMPSEVRALEDIPLPPAPDMAQASASNQAQQEPNVNKNFPELAIRGGAIRRHSGFEANTERGNYQSVMLNQNNNLRQQHQNIAQSNNRHSPSLYQLLHGMPRNCDSNQGDDIDDALLDDLMEKTLTDENVQLLNQNQQPPPYQMQPNTMQIHQTADAPNLHEMSAQAMHILRTTNNMPVIYNNRVVPGMPLLNTQNALISGGLNSQNMPINPCMAPGLTPNLSGMAPGFNTGSGLAPNLSGMAPGFNTGPGLTPNLSGMAPGFNTGLTPGGPPPMNSAHAQSIETTMTTVGVQNTALNSALGLSGGALYPMQMQGPPMLHGQQMSGMAEMHSRPVLGAYQNTDSIPMPPNAADASLFMDHGNPPPNIPTPNMQVGGQNPQHPFPIGMQRANVDEGLADTYYNMMHRQRIQNVDNLANLWYYEDPKGDVQGPFTNIEMLSWFHAGFFSPSLMIRRACEPAMYPLGTCSVLPFSYMETVWSQPGPYQDAVWAQQRRDLAFGGEDAVNSFSPFFWNGPNAGSMNLPAGIVNEMKTEDQILAQIRAQQSIPAPQPAPPFLSDSAPTTASSSTTISSTTISSTTISSTEDSFNVRATPELDKLHQLMSEAKSESDESETKCEKPDKTETPAEPGPIKIQPTQKLPFDNKPSKQAKSEPEKPAKTKDTNNVTKTKSKKSKEEKKDDTETKIKEEESKSEKASVESSPTKSKKEEKLSKKEIEKEKKEWIKEGFTIVKGAEKTNNKENKKKAEEAKVVEEFERKKKEEEKLASEEEKKKKQLDMIIKKQVEQQQRQINEALVKRAPWSVANQALASTKAGLTMSEIQRLEREKKLEQIKEQQHMMHLIAQQQAAALAREQEMQANLAWAKNNLANNGVGPSLAEIQAETRRKSAAAAMAATQAIEDVIPLPQLPTNLVPWGNSTNGGGFWDTQPVSSKLEKPQEPAKMAKPAELKIKKKVAIPNPAVPNPTVSKAPVPNPPVSKPPVPNPAVSKPSVPNPAVSKPPVPNPAVPKPPVPKPPVPKPASTTTASNPTNTTHPAKSTTTTNPSNATNSKPKSDFEAWCETVLSYWKANVDVPTFVGFLRDIESPYEVQEYVRCYLGDSKDSGDFVKQFLEKRAKMIREWKGKATPSDDLCSPAIAVNPRPQLSEYQEVKGKGKKSKKNKMLKVDARILGFSVTASEDRINVGDIDTA